MAVITISRQYGSGGDEIAEMICRATGYHLFDKQILAKAVSEAGLTDQEVIDYSEGYYKVQNLIERLTGRSRPAAQVRVLKTDPEGQQTAEEMPLSEEQAFSLVRKAVEASYHAGNMVIVGRGGQMILRDHPDVLHVRVEAGLEERILRVRGDAEFASRRYSDSVEARRAAQALIVANDDASSDYLKHFYDVDWSDPQLYHLVINTSKLALDQAAKLIVEAARQLEGTAEPV
jgi:cytidylate kinase